MLPWTAIPTAASSLPIAFAFPYVHRRCKVAVLLGMLVPQFAALAVGMYLLWAGLIPQWDGPFLVFAPCLVCVPLGVFGAFIATMVVTQPHSSSANPPPSQHGPRSSSGTRSDHDKNVGISE